MNEYYLTAVLTDAERRHTECYFNSLWISGYFLKAGYERLRTVYNLAEIHWAGKGNEVKRDLCLKIARACQDADSEAEKYLSDDGNDRLLLKNGKVLEDEHPFQEEEYPSMSNLTPEEK